jgi:hypothetical protein
MDLNKMKNNLTKELLEKGLGDLYSCFLRFDSENYISYKFAIMENNFNE